MGTPLRVLIIEDSEDDTLLIMHELKRGGYDPKYERVDTAGAMIASLDKQEWDIVISDHSMPHFNSFNALNVLKKRGLDLAFFLVSGTIDEEMAVSAMKAGVHDYIMKDNLPRLVPAIQRELREAVVRRERKKAEEALQKSEARFQEMFDEAPVGYHAYDVQGRITSVNRTELKMLGYTPEEMTGQPVWKFILEENLSRQTVLDKLTGGLPPARGLERTYLRKDGTTFPALVEDRIIRNSEGTIIGIRSTIQDITERKRAEEEKEKMQAQLIQAQKMESIGTLAGGGSP